MATPTNSDARELTISPSRAWLTQLLLMTGFAISTFDRNILSVVADPLKHDLGLSDTQLGLVQGFAFALCYATAALPLAWLADRSQRVRLIGTLMIVWSMGTAIAGSFRNFSGVLAGRTITAIAEAGYSAAALSVISDIFTPSKLARATAQYMLGPSLGLAMAMIGGGAVYRHFAEAGAVSTSFGTFQPWQMTLWAAAIPGLIVAALLALFVREPVRRSATMPPPGGAVSTTGLRNTLASLGRPLLFYYIGCTLVLLVMFTLAAWSISMASRFFEVNPGIAATTFGPYVLGGSMAGPITIAWWLRRVDSQRITETLTQTAIMAGTLTLVAVSTIAFTTSLRSMALTVGLTIAASSAVSALIVSPVQFLVKNEYRARLQAILSFCFTLVSGGLGPTLVGVASDRVFSGSSALLLAVTSICSVACALGLVCLWISRHIWRIEHGQNADT